MKLAPYKEYKDSGVPWLGRIPAHWSEKRAKYYFKEVDERSQTGEEEMLSVSHITGVTPRSQKNVTMFKAESNVGQKHCQPGDLVINTMWAWMSALGVSNHAGIVSPAYGVYRPRSNQNYDNYYLDHLLRTEGYRSEYICRSTGIRSSRHRLYPDKFLSMPVVCPSQEEQQTIARFLKVKDRLFRKFIRNKRRLIELLKEQKQNIINQAVTRGLDPSVKLKPSGVKWIGDIPEHWEVRHIRACIEDYVAGIWGQEPESKNSAEHIVCIRVADFDMRNLSISQNKLTIRAVRQNAQKTRLLKGGDILMEKSGGGNAEPVGRVVYFNFDFPAVTSNFVTRLRPDSSVVKPRFLLFILSILQATRRNVPSIKQTTGIQNLDERHYLSNNVALPSLEEQEALVSHIERETATIDQTITRAEREIELMREYRTRLISDVVTGKVDVRGIEVLEVAEDELLALDEDLAETDDEITDEGGTNEA